MEENNEQGEETIEELQNGIAVLQKAIKKVDERMGEMYKQKGDLDERKLDLQTNVDELMKQEKANQDELENKGSTAEEAEMLEIIKGLVAQNENIKKSESEFRLKCKEKLEEIEERNEKARERLARIGNNEENQEEEEKARERVKALRLKLAKRSRVVVGLERKIDSVPSRTELSQYQRRFLELYDQVAAKHSETQNFYDMYNNLGDQKSYMEKEIKLLNSILENFEASVGSDTRMKQFVDQMETLLTGVKQAREGAEVKMQEQLKIKEGLVAEKKELLSHQQEYFTLVNKVQEEIKKNQIITEKLEELEK